MSQSDIEEIQRLRQQVAEQETILKGFKPHWVNRAKISTGILKIAYKKHIKPQDVKELRHQGKSLRQIAAMTGVSKSTIQRRLKEDDINE